MLLPWCVSHCFLGIVFLLSNWLCYTLHGPINNSYLLPYHPLIWFKANIQPPSLFLLLFRLNSQDFLCWCVAKDFDSLFLILQHYLAMNKNLVILLMAVHHMYIREKWWRQHKIHQIHIICSVHPRFFTHSFVGQLFLVCLSHILDNFETRS